CLQGTQLPWTF
nr:immunoglobulin light chain junction region [Macaca mulatta]